MKVASLTTHPFPPCVFANRLPRKEAEATGLGESFGTHNAVVAALAIAAIPVSRIVVSARTAIVACVSKGLAPPLKQRAY